MACAEGRRGRIAETRGQMRADGAVKRPKEGVGEEAMDEEREKKRED